MVDQFLEIPKQGAFDATNVLRGNVMFTRYYL